jgi:hypothetical protein
MIYQYLTVDGKSTNIETIEPLSLEELQKLVGGYVEFFNHFGEVGCCNEEGLLKKLPANPHFIDKVIVGNVVLGRWKVTEEDTIFVGVK